MITVDFISLVITNCLVGIRYPGLVLLALLIHEAGKIIAVLFLENQVQGLVVAGVFSTTTLAPMSSDIPPILIALGGPAANYLASSLVGGVEWEKTKALYNPLAILEHPLAVVNFRFAIISLAICLVRLY